MEFRKSGHFTTAAPPVTKMVVTIAMGDYGSLYCPSLLAEMRTAMMYVVLPKVTKA